MMSKRTTTKYLKIDDITIELERKRIKNMYLKILPPDGRVYVTAPNRMPEDTIKEFVRLKADWIRLKQENLMNRVENESQKEELEYQSGESVLLWGKSLQLEVLYSEKHNRVEQTDGKLLLRVKETREMSTVSQRGKLVKVYYRDILSRELPYLFDHWQRIIGVRASGWYIRDMKTRWGTCNVRSKRICMNLRLVTKAPECLEYVVVHELVHLLEMSHNQIFKAYMDKFLPDWRNVKARLNGRERRS